MYVKVQVHVQKSYGKTVLPPPVKVRQKWRNGSFHILMYTRLYCNKWGAARRSPKRWGNEGDRRHHDPPVRRCRGPRRHSCRGMPRTRGSSGEQREERRREVSASDSFLFSCRRLFWHDSDAHADGSETHLLLRVAYGHVAHQGIAYLYEEAFCPPRRADCELGISCRFLCVVNK